MKTLLSITIAILIAITSLDMVPATFAEEQRVGDIEIRGNATVKTSDILRLVDFYPGQPMPARHKVREAERRLFKKFRNQFAEGKFPRIEVEDTENQYHTITIHFPEKK